MAGDWIDELERDAPDIVAAWRGIEAGQLLTVRRQVRRRGGPGSAERIVRQLEATASALAAVVATLPDAAFALPGGESDWTVAEAIGHDAAARAGLVLAASLAASGRWPADAPSVIPDVPGPAGQTRDELLRKLQQSQRIIARGAGRSPATRRTRARSTTRPSAACAAGSGSSSRASTT